jgi:hypothetical protein
MIFSATLGIILWISYTVSYGAPCHPENIPVPAKFVAYQPEGYREQTGKHSANHHYVYVIYEVNGQEVLLEGSANVPYPKETTLYWNNGNCGG